MKGLISIIVPMYNVENYIEKTIKSIMSQSYKHFELILVNDASTDQTLELARTYQKTNENIKLINLPINKGVSAARNIGIRESEGEYLTFVDADDLLTTHALEKLYNTAVKNDADLVLGLYKHLSSEGTRFGHIYKKFKHLTTEGRIFPFTNPEIFSNVYIFGKLYRKELLENISFPEGVSYGEDQPFSMYCYLNAKKIYITPSVVYYYREREQGESATQSIVKNPLENLNSIIDSFAVGKQHFGQNLLDKDTYALLLYISRVIEGSITFILEETLVNNNAAVSSVLNRLTKWIKSLDDFLVAGSNSFQKVFFDNGQIYMKYMSIENQRIYINLLKVIKDKKMNGNNQYQNQIITQNAIIDLFLKSIDQILVLNSIVITRKYSVLFPTVTYFDNKKGKAIIEFQLVADSQKQSFNLTILNIKGNWVVDKLDKINCYNVTPLIKSSKPKVLLVYRDFSGCNTLALYKNIPAYINETFDIEFVQGNEMSTEYARKVVESDVVITTNMEYGFYKFGFNPNKIVIDLWHGFPLKNMFYNDPNYRDKNNIAPFWKQFNYLLSYSELYSEFVNDCIKANADSFFITGAPRNDLLYQTGSREKLFKLLNKEDSGQKFIIYMPTFRLADQKNILNENLNLFNFPDFNFIEFEQMLKDNNFELIVKSHPVFTTDFERLIEGSEFINLIKSADLANEFIDLYEILDATDVLITDYSSIYFDYLLLDKPIIFTPVDLESYQQERGFIVNSYEEWVPGPKAINQESLQKEILMYTQNYYEYKGTREAIRKKVHAYEDGYSTKRVWDFIYQLKNNEESVKYEKSTDLRNV